MLGLENTHHMNKNYDALIEISLFSADQGGRIDPIYSGYRGAHLIKEDYLTSGIIELIEKEKLLPGETTKAFVNYITPEEYPHSLWIGKEMNIQEGSHIVGISRTVEVYNEILLKEKT